MALKPHPTKPDTFVFEGTRPYKKEWVGLTEDETDGLIHSATYMDETDLWHLVSLVEERLKEKNGG